VQALHENAQNIFGRRYFGGTGFLQSFTCVCFLTLEKREQSSFKSMITRWFNPTWLSFRNETEITLQIVNWHSTVAEQN